MMNSFRFGTAINCIDGRTQQVARVQWGQWFVNHI
jgi:hypothetical protein